MFDDRTDAGRRLADLLEERGLEADLVLGIPRGALPVARPVADALGADLDVVVAQKIGAPGNPELAIGAAASDGSVWLNEALVERLGVPDSHVEREREREAERAREKAAAYRPGGRTDLPELTGERVVVVDDGVATGATAIACLRQLRENGAARVILAVPVGSPDSLERLEDEADEIVALRTPADFRAVGQYYRDFGQVSDDEAIEYLDLESG
ncbi:phosphoribosyltransferase [Halomontanus rarus]|uniref:phosphoribosyltransferase n=1 Tax=Halomontanus rarus TaxID=3034020 RepID=UPI0023E8764F|nr:phosphoribosyltransferase family protein [Halovivax sp. TS33]